MKLRNCFLVAACVFLLALSGSPASAARAARPNVVIFLADDSGWGDYSVTGNCFIRWLDGGIRAGTVVKEITGAIDLLPTLTAMTGVKRSANAPNCSYFVNWTSLDDRMTWDIAVNATGSYEVEIFYTRPVADAGSAIELEFNGSKLSGKVAPGWDPPLYANQDTITRPAAESKMKEFRSLNLGVMRLEKGRGPLTLRALKIPGKSVMDVRQLTLTLEK